MEFAGGNGCVSCVIARENKFFVVFLYALRTTNTKKDLHEGMLDCSKKAIIKTALFFSIHWFLSIICLRGLKAEKGEKWYVYHIMKYHARRDENGFSLSNDYDFIKMKVIIAVENCPSVPCCIGYLLHEVHVK